MAKTFVNQNNKIDEKKWHLNTTRQKFQIKSMELHSFKRGNCGYQGQYVVPTERICCKEYVVQLAYFVIQLQFVWN